MKEKTKEFMKKNFKWLVLFIALIGFLALAEDVFNKEIMNGDIIGYKIISTFLISDFATPIAKFITNFGGAIFLIILTVILFILIKNKKIGLSIFSNLVLRYSISSGSTLPYFTFLYNMLVFFQYFDINISSVISINTI